MARLVSNKGAVVNVRDDKVDALLATTLFQKTSGRAARSVAEPAVETDAGTTVLTTEDIAPKPRKSARARKSTVKK